METIQLFNDRRSINFFDKNKKLDLETVEKVINLSVLAPSAFNLQPWRLIVVESDSAKEKLLKLANNQAKISEAPISLILIGNKNGWDNNNPVWSEMLEYVGGNEKIVEGSKKAAAHLYGSSEERKLKFAESNTGLLAMSIMIAAKEFGVDTHPMSGIDFDGIHSEFKLNKNETVVMILTMGYFDKSKTLNKRRKRLNFKQITTII